MDAYSSYSAQFNKMLFDSLMPHPNETRNTDASDRIACMAKIPPGMMSSESLMDMVSVLWKRLYSQAVDAVSREIVGRKEYFTVRFIPQVLQSMMGVDKGIMLRLDYEIIVTSTHPIVLPVFKYSEEGKMIEWRCGYCSSPNVPEKRHCSQCGAPRALLIQEMQT